MSETKSKSSLAEKAYQWYSRNSLRIAWIFLLTGLGYFGAGLPGAILEFSVFSGIALGASAATAYSKHKRRKASRKKRTTEVYGEEEIVSKEWTTFVRLMRPIDLEVSLSVGGKIRAETYGDTVIERYDLEANEAIDNAWREYGEENYMVMDYRELNNGTCTHEDDWIDKKKWSIFD